MKAPDKLFVSNDPFGFMEAYYMENHPPYGEEYIRKDALLEWAKDVKTTLENQHAIKDDICKGSVWELEEIIAKIESL